MSSAIVILDTSVFDEILAIPGWAQATDEIQDQLEEWIDVVVPRGGEG